MSFSLAVSAIWQPSPSSIICLRSIASRAGRGHKLKVGSTLYGGKSNMREDGDIANPAILFLCLGNLCRSPLAEGAARAAFARAGIDVRLDSAGTGDWHVGHAPDVRAQA